MDGWYGIIYVNSTTRWMSMRNALDTTDLTAAWTAVATFLFPCLTCQAKEQ